jgi:hypothetical protein
MTERDGGRGARAVRVVVAMWCRVRVYGLSWGRQGNRGATLATGGRQGRGRGQRWRLVGWRMRRGRREEEEAKEEGVAGSRSTSRGRRRHGVARSPVTR